MVWDQDRTELCVKLWNEGYSATQVAQRIGGVSRNAVIGKIHRLGLSNTVSHRATKFRSKCNGTGKRKSRKGKPRSDFNALLFVTKVPRLPDSPLPPEPERPISLVTFDDLTESMCRFPYGDPKTADFGFCGCKSLPGSPYCEGHHARMYTAPRPKSRYNPAGQPPAGIPKTIAKYIPSAEDCAEAIG